MYEFKNYRLEDDPCPYSGRRYLLSENENKASNKNDEKRDKNARGRMHDSSGQDGQKPRGREHPDKDAFKISRCGGQDGELW